ncbi:MAG: PASTA domain-containing protein [Gammaproteobacteria bacterium]
MRCWWVLGFVAPVAHATSAGANGHIAYTKLVDKGQPSERRAIFIDGGQVSFPQPLSNGANSDAFPAFSPNGKQIAFVRHDYDADDDVFYVANVDGSMPHRLMGLDEWDLSQGLTTRSRAVGLLWAPDGQSVAFVRKYLPPSSQADSIGRVYIEDGSIGRVGVDGSFAIDGFDWLAGADAAHSGKIIVPCHSVQPRTVFCLYSDTVVSLLGVTALPPEPQYDSMATVQHNVPMLQPLPDGGPPRVMFAMYVPVPVGGSSVYVNSIFSIVPSDGSLPEAQGTDVTEHTPGRELLTCNTVHAGVSGTVHFPRYIYGDPVPSPDGNYFLTSRVEQSFKTRTENGEVYCDTEQVANDLRVFRDDGAEERLVDTDVDTTNGIAWQPLHPNVRITVTDGHTDPLHGASVELRDPEDDSVVRYSGPVNANAGEYLFEGVTPGRYRLRVTLDDTESHEFDVENDLDGVSAWEERKVTVPSAGAPLNFGFPFNDTDIVAASVDSSFNDRLDAMAAIFYQLRVFVDWVHSNLTTDTGSKVKTHAFASDVNATQYASDIIYMTPKDSLFTNRSGTGYAPVNGEWHEFAHHLQSVYTSLGCGADVNHAGYINPDTCDSLVEGFASYLAAKANGLSDYAGIMDFGDLIKAWQVRECRSGLCSAEDLAVASLLWSLTDTDSKQEGSYVLGLNGARVPVTYNDGIGMSLRDLWKIMISAKPYTVYDLRLALDADPRFGAVTVDLDGDNVPDITALDQLFLMHGFFGITNDMLMPGAHPQYHYDAESARNPASPNDGVGASHHLAFSLGGVNFPARPIRFNIEPAPAANLSISAHDAAGHEVQGAQVAMTVHYPGYDRELERALPTASGSLVHLELPMYFDYLPLPNQVGVPPCDPENDYYVSVTLTATVNGYSSTNTHGFDNCSYLQAQLAASGSVAASYDMMFPEDSVPPTTTIDIVATGDVVGQFTDGTWKVTLHCDDPVTNGFASGCLTTRHSLDGAPFAPYADPVVISEPGLHTFYFMSRDASGNAEAMRSVSLGIGQQLDDETPPVTTASPVASVPPTGDRVTTGYWTVSLSCADPDGTPGALVSGCQGSMYSIDGSEFAPYAGPVQIRDAGLHTFSYFSFDVTGNYESPKSIQLEVATVEQASVPDVLGLTQAAAAAAITNAGLVLGSVTQQASDSVPAGSVISQSPTAGTNVAAGTGVNLVTSSGAASGSPFDVLKAATQATHIKPPALKIVLLLDFAHRAIAVRSWSIPGGARGDGAVQGSGASLVVTRHRCGGCREARCAVDFGGAADTREAAERLRSCGRYLRTLRPARRSHTSQEVRIRRGSAKGRPAAARRTAGETVAW